MTTKTLDADGNLADQDGRSRHQQRERDQVIENAIAHRFAEGVGGDVYNSSAHCVAFIGNPHCVTPATALDGCSLRTKYSSSEVRTGINDMTRSCSRRRAFKGCVLIALKKHGADGVAGDVAIRT